MPSFRQMAVVGAVGWSLALPAAGRGAEVQANPPGLAVSAQAPGFSLTAQDGKTYALTNLIQEAPLALVFHRSADW